MCVDRSIRVIFLCANMNFATAAVVWCEHLIILMIPLYFGLTVFTCPYCALALNIPLVFIQHLSCQLPAQGAVESKQKEGHLGLELFERALLMFVIGLPIKENLVTP